MKRLALLFLLVLATACTGKQYRCHCDAANALPAEGYVAIADEKFVLDGETWFPIMLNYKAFMSDSDVVPAPWYGEGSIRSHFDTIAAWGFNAVRVCLDVLPDEGDTAVMFRATHRMVQAADSAGLHVMLLVKPLFDPYWTQYTIGLMRHLADLPALWAYDFLNEPLYFDPIADRDKCSAAELVCQWRALVRQYAPHQLFTVATAEPIEVFEWDPSMLSVDFVEMHTYHPLRVQAEMWWYAHHAGHPWMVGETGLPSDNYRVPYTAQAHFLDEAFDYARSVGAIGFGWWEFQDYPEGVNFEAQYTGLRDTLGHRKPAVAVVQQLARRLHTPISPTLAPPSNYYNMLAYSNVAAIGRVVDPSGHPIEGAVIRGWNDDWSIGMNTFSDSVGQFRLVSNDLCSHFEVSAPGYERIKFNRQLDYPSALSLPSRGIEYQQIRLLGWGDEEHVLPRPQSQHYLAPTAVEAQLGDLLLRPIDF